MSTSNKANVTGSTERERRDPDVLDQLDEHLLGPVRRGRDAVRRQHPHRHEAPEPLGGKLLADHWRAEQDVLDPVAEGLGDLDGALYVTYALGLGGRAWGAHWR